MSLSDELESSYDGEGHAFNYCAEESIKEFIQRLKEINEKGYYGLTNDQIDKEAGEKLIIKSNKEEKMGEVLLKTEIPREKGYLYYCATASDGNLTVCKTKMARGRKKKDKKE